MPSYDDITVKVADSGRATIVMDRPEQMNTISPQMTEEIDDALSHLEENDDVRVLVLRGRGENFCAGADVSDDRESTTPATRIRSSRQNRHTFNYLESFAKPTVAAIQGYALGGGCELACCCDTRIAAESATIGVPEIRLGVIPAGGGTQRLARLIGVSRAKDMVLRGKHYSAEEMKDAGFVHELVDEDAFEEKVDEVVDQYLKHPPIAMEVAKHTVNRGFESSLETGLEMESWGAAIVTSTEDAKEGLEAFRENREPEFEGK
jgi:enoyl-CoA hydratase/3-hydroxyacyl-CoA dehydrogenase